VPDRVARRVLAALVCPSCRGEVSLRDDTYVCRSCGRSFEISNGTPIFVEPAAAAHDELDHLANEHGHAPADVHKAAQAAYFDRTALAEFEIERPNGSPGLYRFLLSEKFRRTVEPFKGRLDGWTALTVCGGSGMDAEFLAGAGASVISSDLSSGAADRVHERARRHGTPIEPIVADIEHLPFGDRSIDLVYVHDGLHHLDDPMAGVAEMARVARRAVCITEPARARATAIGIRFGVALEREEAGNRVARLEPAAVTAALRSAGFRIIRADRYAMYYHHVPGRITAFLSRKPILPVAVFGWRVVNRLVGRAGNKLTIVAVR
jgi:ubiquinone/menaquinone biosynthesis C-methylase UbiE/uncharacterized protein YbaR (Trm112 family)